MFGNIGYTKPKGRVLWLNFTIVIQAAFGSEKARYNQQHTKCQ